MHARLTEWTAEHGYEGRFCIEPGRYIAAECGVLLGRVHAIKSNGDNLYAGTDIGFNQLMRPVLYDAYHDIEIFRENGKPDAVAVEQTVVGNICESGDILAKSVLCLCCGKETCSPCLMPARTALSWPRIIISACARPRCLSGRTAWRASSAVGKLSTI